jgi:MFS family permease
VLLITRTGGSYAQAGVVSAAFSLVASAVTPLLGRLADRHGQAAVLVRASALKAVGILALVAAAVGHAPVWVRLAAAVVIGTGYAPVGTLVRARWSYATAGTALGHTAYSWESVVDEVIFITGPVLVTVLCTQVAPAAGLLAAATFGVVGACLLVPQRSTEPPRPTFDGRPHRSAIRRPAVLGMTLVSVGLGGLFGSIEVAVVAYTTERGQAGLSGGVLAAFAFGSLLAGLAYGAAPPRTPPAWRLVVATGVLTAVIGTFPLLPGTAALTGAIFLAGLAVAPSLICGYALLEASVPAAARTEAMAWLPTGIGVGISAGATVVGWVIDSHGARPAFVVPAAAGLLAVTVAVLIAVRQGPAAVSVPDARMGG